MKQLEQEHADVSPYSHKFKILMALESEKHDLPEAQIKEMILSFERVLSRKPKNIPDNWKLKWCKFYLAPRYENPNDSMEYIVTIPHDDRGFLPYIIHHTRGGFADARWFYEIVPQLEQILRDKSLGRPFSFKFNEAINQMFGDQMTRGQVQAINVFFGKFVPGIEGVCSTCYKVSLPDSGSGEKWTYRRKNKYEIRLSAAKPNGKAGQKVEYVSHTELDSEGNLIFATWDKEKSEKGFDYFMRQKNTHIPWEVYDFDKFSLRMPLCTCRK